MKEHFLQYAESHHLFEKSRTYIAAVSGGVDSMVLVHLLQESGISFVIAHCHFGLRGEESDADTALVEQYAAAHHIPFFVEYFSPDIVRYSPGLSLQMAARELRYSWFRRLMQQHGYAGIITAHHADDNTETVLLNLVRGTGIDGLTGMEPQQEDILRPLLFAGKKAIREYAAEQEIIFREDRSNAENIYKRNLLRNEVIPLLEQMNPAFLSTFTANIGRFQQVAHLYRQAIVRLQRELLVMDMDTGWEKMAMLELVGRGISPEILFDILRDKGITLSQAENMLDHIGAQPGSLFHTATHEIFTDRGFFLIKPLDEDLLPPYEITVDDLALGRKGHFSWEMTTAPVSFEKNQQMSWFDRELLPFPLQVRYWQEGDDMQPLGMKGRKKLSDIFTDEKIPLPQKKRIPLLVAGNEILWIAGVKVSDKAKVTEGTKVVVKISLEYNGSDGQ